MCGSGGVGKTTTAAALAATAAAELGGRVLVLTVDPARRLADAAGPRRDRQRRGAGARQRVAGGGRGAPGRAVGRHARHQGVVGRPDRPPRPRRPHPRRHPGQPPLRQHHRALRPEPRLHRHGAALRAAHVGSLRPRRGRHAAVAPRARLPRRARAHGGLLRQPPVALAHRAVAVPPRQRGVEALLPSGRPGPGLAVPGRHRRVLHAARHDARGVRAAGPGRRPGAGRPTVHLRGGDHPRRAGAAARPTTSWPPWPSAACRWARWC